MLNAVKAVGTFQVNLVSMGYYRLFMFL